MSTSPEPATMQPKAEGAPCPRCGGRCMQVSVLTENFTRWFCEVCAAGGPIEGTERSKLADLLGWSRS